jgi:CheY-like chemotaxis protein
VLTNLVGNAVKFTLQGSVDLTCAIESERLCFRVRDSGIGIPKEDIGRLFTPFTQVDSAQNRRFGGTGLGLAISKRLTEALGGTIDLDSVDGQGSVFTVRLPLVAGASSPTRSASMTAPTPVNGMRVLIVEDNLVNQQVARRFLARRGIESQVAPNGKEALDVMARESFDLVLMDCQMPEMDGFEATRAIRVIETTQHTPIVAMTASVQPRDRAACIAAGMDDYLAKPLRSDELDRVLQRFATPAAQARSA